MAPALAIPAVASTPKAFVPDGFVFVSEAVGDLGGPHPGVAQVYENASGRRALLLGMRRPDGFEATGWGFVLPCRTCGGDLPAEKNLEVTIRQGTVHIIDRSEASQQGMSTRAELVFRRDPASLKWRLSTLKQLTVFTQNGNAELAFTDYERGETRDEIGRYSGSTFTSIEAEAGTIDKQVLTLDGLVLY